MCYWSSSSVGSEILVGCLGIVGGYGQSVIYALGVGLYFSFFVQEDIFYGSRRD